MTNQRKLKLGILAALFIVIMATMASCVGSKNPVARYQKIAQQAEYPSWLKRHTPFFKSNKDWRIKVAENQVKAFEIRKEQAEKESEILKKVKLIKSQIK